MKLGFLENCCSVLLLIARYFQRSHAQIGERLSLGSILHVNQTLVSSNGTFALGIFSLGPDRNYLGVSYGFCNITPYVWVANRNHPAKNGAYFRFSSDGNMVIYNPDQTTVWMSGTSGMNISSMVMEESGNVVLKHNSGKVIWQSFDHPTDTWFPGMKMYLGSYLTSSKSPVDIAESSFSMRLLQTTKFMSMWNNSVEYWTSGAWNGNTFSDAPPQMPQLYNFSLLNDSERPYFTWSEKQNTHYSHFTLESDGILRVRTWDSVSARWYSQWTQPKDPCQVAHLCGQNGICNSDFLSLCSCPQGFKAVDPTGWSQGDWSLGCVPNFSVDCSTKEFSFLPHTAYDQASSAGSARAYSGHDQAWCQSQCINNCACLGFSFDGSNSNCSLQYGPFFSGKNSPDIVQNFFLRVHSSSPQYLGNKKSSRVWIIGLGVAAGCAVLLLIVLLLRQTLLRKRIADRQSSEYISRILKRFSYKEIRSATNNFSEKIGAGGFGSVYKGCLRDQTKVGVKKLNNMKQGDKDFRAEVSTLGIIQHVNLVRLRGFCADDNHRLLVYDYMPNGSLNSLLFSKPGAQQQVVLDWDTRFSIALGTARGITYLHEECRKCIIHCDIKPENILLDTDFCAKVSDFGLAKLMNREFSRVITSMRGTRGYLAPEWLSGMPVTAKADVYSYGMTLLEIVSGRRNIDVKSSLDKWFFPLWACQRGQLGDFSSLADSKLCGNFNQEQLKNAVLVALWCIQDEETSRPTMGRVVQMLEGTLDVAEAPFPKSVLLLEVNTHSPLQLPMPTFERGGEEHNAHERSQAQTNSMDFM